MPAISLDHYKVYVRKTLRNRVKRVCITLSSIKERVSEGTLPNFSGVRERQQEICIFRLAGLVLTFPDRLDRKQKRLSG